MPKAPEIKSDEQRLWLNYDRRFVGPNPEEFDFTVFRHNRSISGLENAISETRLLDRHNARGQQRGKSDEHWTPFALCLDDRDCHLCYNGQQ